MWDDFTDVPGRVKDGSTAAVACDHVHRYRETWHSSPGSA